MATGAERVYISIGDDSYQNLFLYRGYEIEEDITKANLVVLTGGPDIHPLLYKQLKEDNTISSINRDEMDLKVFYEAKMLDLPIVGICRGAQFLCVMNGGSLHQHDETKFHLSSHNILINDSNWDGEKKMIASANHHQIMEPMRDCHILAKAEKENTPEVVVWPSTKCLAHQPHPEWMSYNTEYVNYFFHTIQLLK